MEKVQIEPVRYRNDTYCVRSFENTVVNDRVVKRLKYVNVNPSEKMSGFKASDFALENVIAVGALDSLKECRLNYNSTGETSDNLDTSVDNLITALNEQQTQNVESQSN